MSGRVSPGRVLGIDLSAATPKTYACTLVVQAGSLEASIDAGCDDACLLELAKGCSKVAIDAPFGWPSAFVDAIDDHRSGRAWPAPDEGDPAVFRASLSYRATDRLAMQTRHPLSVSTDRLGVTAMRCAHLLQRWSGKQPVSRTGTGRFLEVYPAGALVRWGLEAFGYKGGKRDVREGLIDQICKALPALRLAPEQRELCASVDDAFDSLVAALVARAAALGLTTPPPKHLRELAAEEGWIHLPLRGSMPLLAHSRADLKVNAAPALASSLIAAGIRLDKEGYGRRIEDALLPSFDPKTIEAIKRDLGGKGGSELKWRRRGPAKFLAAHSSAALAANTFGPFLQDHDGVPLRGHVFAGPTHLEQECKTGLSRVPPTLDLLVDGPEVLAVESKCLEPFGRHSAKFREAYEDATAEMHRSWREEYERLKQDPDRYRYLDAAQLIKHYIGLKRNYGDKPVTFVYLYWRPSNAAELAPCLVHKAEIAEFSRRLKDPKIGFSSLSHPELWREWTGARQPTWLKNHGKLLCERYDIAVAT